MGKRLSSCNRGAEKLCGFVCVMQEVCGEQRTDLLESGIPLVSWKQCCYLLANTAICFLKHVCKGHTMITNKPN